MEKTKANLNINTKRNETFRTLTDELKEKADELSVQCNARVAVLARSPVNGRVVAHGSPCPPEDVLDAYGYEFNVTDPTLRFQHYLQVATANVDEMSDGELQGFMELLENVVKRSKTRQMMIREGY